MEGGESEFDMVSGADFTFQGEYTVGGGAERTFV